MSFRWEDVETEYGPTRVGVRSCDGPSCPTETTTETSQDWLIVEVPRKPDPDDRWRSQPERLEFCSRRCVAEWAAT